jgi:hypothetical protein
VRDAGCGLRGAGCGVRDAGYGLRVVSCGLRGYEKFGSGNAEVGKGKWIVTNFNERAVHLSPYTLYLIPVSFSEAFLVGIRNGYMRFSGR